MKARAKFARAFLLFPWKETSMRYAFWLAAGSPRAGPVWFKFRSWFIWSTWCSDEGVLLRQRDQGSEGTIGEGSDRSSRDLPNGEIEAGGAEPGGVKVGGIAA